MLGAACLTSLAAMRSGAGLVTAAIPKALNLTLQKKISHVVMTLCLPQTKQMTFSVSAATILLRSIHKFSSVAIGPGLSLNPSTALFAQHLIKACPLPMVVDADALNALEGKTDILLNANGPRILTPHPGEMARLIALDRTSIEKDRSGIARDSSRKFNCILVLKGHRTVVASPDGKLYINKTGNPGMATAGSGDVLTGMIAGLLAQGVKPLEAARYGVKWHGEAGDRAAKRASQSSMIAEDIIHAIR